MPVNLSIKNVPDHIAEMLRQRADKHHRSPQGELMSILKESVSKEKALTPSEFLEEMRTLGLKTREESVVFIRKDRDGHSCR